MINIARNNEAPAGFKLLSVLEGHHDQINRLAWSPDGKILASGSSDKKIIIWDWENRKEPIKILEGHTHWVNSVAWSPNMDVLASGSTDNRIRLWDIGTGKCLPDIMKLNGAVYSVSWSPDGIILASGSWDSAVIIWKWTDKTLKWLGTFRKYEGGHSRGVNSVAWSPDGKLLASGSADSTIRIWKWDGRTLERLQSLKGHTGGVTSVTWLPSPDRNILVSGSSDGTIRLWNTETGEQVRTLEGHKAMIKCVSFSYDGHFLASKSADDNVQLRYGETWETLRGLSEPTKSDQWRNGLAFHPNRPILATLGEKDTIIRVWDLQIHQVIKALEDKWHSILDISKETELEPQIVSEIVSQNTNILVKSSSTSGEEQYTVWQQFLSSTSLSFWIFQAVLEQYDIRKKLHKGSKETWYATRFHNKMHPGDIVFFWLSGVPIEDRGIYAWGRLTSESRKEPNWETHGVDIIVERILPSPITVPRIKQIDILSKMLILRMDIGTNFLLTNEEVQALASLCAEADSEWPASLPKEQF